MIKTRTQGKLRLVASRGGDDGSVTINQDVSLYASVLAKDEAVSYKLSEGRAGNGRKCRNINAERLFANRHRIQYLRFGNQRGWR